VAIDSANNICIGGYTVPYYAAALVVKATSAGAPTWARSYSETEAVPKGTVAVDSSDNVYFTSERSDNGRRMRLFKLNSSGTQQWARTLNGGSNTDVIMEDLATDSSGNVYVSGRTDYQSFGGIDVILAKWNTSGVFQWQRRLGGSSSDIAYALAVSPAGDVFVGGQFISGGNKGLVARYNTSGTIQWQRSVLWRTSTDIRGMSLDGSSAFYVSGVGTAGTTYSVTNAYLPQDGSRTGSYTDFTYSASSLSEAAGTLFEASWSGSVGNVSGLTLNDSTVLTVTTPTFTSTLTNV